ncbi:hypothetical protein DPMN_166818 [Dreissena polymorpha]|uniref:Uncharacterized protein n=1 Tax=Dreissena polymorpha TaxID=45954 RepID=A0A9D4EZL2_DREPO|nr:hypothetical protein DPMN_166818 [Dreissena polymorpha]
MMNILHDGKSATERVALFQLRNMFAQRSVTCVVSESFNYVSDCLKFFTEGYVITFALDELGVSFLDEEAELTPENLNAAAVAIVDKILCPITLNDDDTATEDNCCICRQG